MTRPVEAGVYMRILREPGRQDLVTIGGWTPSRCLGDGPCRWPCQVTPQGRPGE